MKVKSLHSWDLDYGAARALQEELAGQVRHTPLGRSPRVVAGMDCAFSGDKKRICAVIVVLEHPDFRVIETVRAVSDVTFPYIPGLLSFREAPVCLAAAEKLKTTPDAFLIDGQGIAHPRRLGLAAHLGLFLDRPTIGCAKSRLIGTYDEPKSKKGNWSLLYDKTEQIGAVVRTRTDVKPLFISVGNQCTRDDAIEIALQWTSRYRLPEPTRLAHQAVTVLRNEL
ncbi:MAG: deoxyribonuclease V [Sedimentisphaerales bacterium]|nr:deoxyribonuclease V [Sedimentisphaerales bacterium]